MDCSTSDAKPDSPASRAAATGSAPAGRPVTGIEGGGGAPATLPLPLLENTKAEGAKEAAAVADVAAEVVGRQEAASTWSARAWIAARLRRGEEGEGRDMEGGEDSQGVDRSKAMGVGRGGYGGGGGQQGSKATGGGGGEGSASRVRMVKCENGADWRGWDGIRPPPLTSWPPRCCRSATPTTT